MSIATFGSVVFETSADLLRTWSSFQRKAGIRLAAHEVLDGKPVTEFIGPGLDEISLQVKLDAGLGVNPIAEINALRAIRDAGQANSFTVHGRNLGTFTLEAVEEDWTAVDNTGLLLSATATLKLKEYAERQ